MSDRILQQIQSLQFKDQETANKLLKEFLNTNLPLKIKEVKVRPLAVSLNSINGFLTTEDEEKLFFKTHIEPQSIIHEYYNSSILAEAGYPVIQPIYSSTEWGKQLLIYRFFDSPSLFNVVRDLEVGNRNDGEKIISIQRKADQDLWQIYLQTLEFLEAEKHTSAPVHQLFYHRLTGGRFHNFYKGINLLLPEMEINFDGLSEMKWIINGVKYQHTLGELVELATDNLNPSKNSIPSIIGHGDAHNGNVFYDEEKENLIYFDPAFAGRHSPFLDLTKPLFHNVFAIWMYYPEEISRNLSIKWEIKNDTVILEHDFIPHQVRIEILRSKLELVLKPLLSELQTRNWLPERWREDLKLALFCCPFLTMNLSDRKKFNPQISLLGLATSVCMGSSSVGKEKSLLDSEIDKIL